MTASIRIGPLLPYQLEALRLVANGLTDREIARVTGRSQDTVRTRVRRCCELLGARSRPHAVALAMGAGLLAASDVRGVVPPSRGPVRPVGAPDALGGLAVVGTRVRPAGARSGLPGSGVPAPDAPSRPTRAARSAPQPSEAARDQPLALKSADGH